MISGGRLEILLKTLTTSFPIKSHFFQYIKIPLSTMYRIDSWLWISLLMENMSFTV